MVSYLATSGGWMAVPMWAVVGVGSLSALAALYLLVLAVAARIARPVYLPPRAGQRLTVVIPAHDEEALIGRCVASLRAQEYPSSAYDIVVIADNCTDGTATVAAEAGARVLVRDNPEVRGKGAALRWAFDVLLSEALPPDALVVVDADSVADPKMLAGLAACLDGGAQVVQAEYLALAEDTSMIAELRAAAFLLFHRVRFKGRAALGLPCSLVGNGMLFSRRVLEDHPWNAFTSVEDLEYSIDLRLAGIGPAFAGNATVRGPVSAGGSAARTQRLRWEGGRVHVVRTRLPKLLFAVLGRGRWSQLDAAIDLMVPPLGVLAALAVVSAVATGLLVGFHVLPAIALIPPLVAVGAISGFVLIGLWAAGAPTSTFKALGLAPFMVASQLADRLRLLGGLGADRWERTARSAAVEVEPPEMVEEDRFVLGGVPIDPLGMDEALERLRGAIRERQMTHLCTVNLDFLANARRYEDVRSLLQQSDFNLPDGAPVVWLGKLQGRKVPGRVAGSDLVPRLLSVAAEEGARVFLLGGEDGVAAEAARRMIEANPALVIADVYEPPRQALADMNHQAILERIRNSRADILLVALGHPKQDRWIRLNRELLDVSVAMGVGCTFDLIAGRRQRAPRWMGASGLEWLYRCVHEPRRLGSRYATDAWYLLAVLIPLAVGHRLRRRKLQPVT
jgi:1,2-diacylglycerol 3-beta-glucosyltransferase